MTYNIDLNNEKQVRAAFETAVLNKNPEDSAKYSQVLKGFHPLNFNKIQHSINLLSAANDGNIDKINESLNKGADINYQNSTRVTALHFAARNFQDDAVATLLRPRNNFLISNDIANVNAKDNDDLTPLDYVVLRKAEISLQNNQLMTVDQLLNHGAVVDETTLFNAKNNIEVFKKCLCFADYKVIKATVEKIPNEAILSNFHRYPELETKKGFKKYTDNPVEYIAQQYHDNIPMLKKSYDKFRNTTKNSREDYKISLIEALIVLDKKEPKLEKLKSQIEQLQKLGYNLSKEHIVATN